MNAYMTNMVLQMKSNASHISESCHYYTEDGQPCYEVAGKNGKMVKTTLSLAKKLHLFPSVTTILSCASKPFVDNWRIETYLKEIHAHFIDRETSSSTWRDYKVFRGIVMDLVEPKLSEGSSEGSNIHAAISEHLKGKEYPDKYKVIIANLGKVFNSIGFDMPSALSEIPFCHKEQGYAGCIDAHSQMKLVDFKSTSDKNYASLCKRPYVEYSIQLAAYLKGLNFTGVPVEQIYNIIINRETGECFAKLYDPLTLEEGWKMFSNLLEYWKCKNQHYPETTIKGADIMPF